MDNRRQLLDAWANSVLSACTSGAIDRGRKINVLAVEAVKGPRAGAIEIHAGLDSARLLRIMGEGDAAMLRQFVPWDFAGEPAAYMSGRFVRLEAGWPDDMAERDIRLSSLGRHPIGAGRWIAGKNEIGTTITLGLSDTCPHVLIGGWTGSGKSYAVRSAIWQLSQDQDNRLILIDGKYGQGLAPLAHLPGVIGPVATDVESARSALAYALDEMRNRYESGILDKGGRLIVVIDEVQEFAGTTSGDGAISEMLRRLVTQGRASGVHLIVCTQHPTKDTFADPTVKRNLTGRVALRVEDYKASEMVVGKSEPRADRLLGAGDAYLVTPSAMHRAQLAYVTDGDIQAVSGHEPMLDAWPAFQAEDMGQGQAGSGGFEPCEIAVSLEQAHRKAGRPALQRAMVKAGMTKPGSERAARLLELGRGVYNCLSDNGYTLAEID